MAILLRDKKLDEDLELLASWQPVPTTKTALAKAMLMVAIEKCRWTEDHEAWRLDSEDGDGPPEADRSWPCKHDTNQTKKNKAR
jgi:hypothetical protein